MARITALPFVRHISAAPTAHIRHERNGAVVHDGRGLAFWFRPLAAAISEIPVDDRELPMLFHARTSDFQDVSVQATVTYRVVDPALAAVRLDFSIDPTLGRWRGTPLEQLGGLLAELAQQHAIDLVATTPVTEIVTRGAPALRERIAAGLAGDARLTDIGVGLVDVRVVAVRPEPDLERALQTPTRELVQQQADRATYERRAVAVERERAIAENELQSQIELARREEQLVAQRGANERRRAEEAAVADRIANEARVERDRLVAQADADAVRTMGAAEGEAEQLRLAAYGDTTEGVLLALAARELAAHLPAIGTLNLTPDLLTPVLARLGGDRQ